MSRTVTTFLLLGFSCLWLSTPARAQTKAPPQLTREQREALRKEYVKANTVGIKYYEAGRGVDALKAFRKGLEIAEQLYPEEDYPNGHLELAASLNNLGSVLQELGEARKALPYYERALAMKERLYNKKDHPDLAASLNSMGAALRSVGEAGKALPYYERALAMRERLYQRKDHPDLAASLNNMGAVLRSVGEGRKALSYYERALAMRERLYDRKDHPELAASLNNIGGVLLELGEGRQALSYYERALAMKERLYTRKDHPDLAASLSGMGSVLLQLGEGRKALPYYERALAMCERLFDTRDHPYFASSLNNLGGVLQELGEARKALPYYERALAMCERMYNRKDHPDLAGSLNNLGLVLQELGEGRKALPYVESALLMHERLCHKKDHPALATSLNNVGFVLRSLGEGRKALPYYERALAMYERLYDKKDHSHLATSLANMGVILQELGEGRKALPYLERALAMQRALIAERALSAAEAELLAYTTTFPRTRDLFLSACLEVEGSDQQAYAQVWQGKAALTRILQARHLAARSARDAKTQAAWEQLAQTRRDLARLLNTPGMDREQRDKQLRQLNDAKEGLERQLVALLPEYQRLTRTDQQGVDDLLKALPANAVFVDLLRYHKFDKEGGKLHYVAFVLRQGKPIVRVELGAAKDIDQTLAAWLRHLNAWKPGLPPKDARDLQAETDRLGQKLSKRVWTPLAPHLPAHAGLYLSPDGDLSRLPWAALPFDDESVLVQKHLLCQVPHGPFLLERLTTKKKAADRKGSVLAVGGVDYGTPTRKPGAPHYPELPGTRTELKQVLTLAGQRDRTSLSGKEASTARVLAELLRANYVHLATHGEFKEALLSEERQRIQEQLQHWQGPSALGTDRLGLGIRNPLSYVGVALAQANEPAQAGPDGGILSAETIVEQPLEKVRLTVLSACETGLGAYTQAEGVQGLVRAFHVAGCPNVVASLWKVNDEATAALMARFYRELWEEGKSPAEALRAAQLLLYTHPEVVGPLARGVRGAPDFDRAVKVDPGKDAASKGKRLPPKLWAAFVISGIGQ